MPISVVRRQPGNHFLLGEEIANRRFDEARQFGTQALFDASGQFADELLAQLGIRCGGRLSNRKGQLCDKRFWLDESFRLGLIENRRQFSVDQQWYVVFTNGIGEDGQIVVFTANLAFSLHQGVGPGEDGAGQSVS